MPNFRLTHLPLDNNLVTSEKGRRIHPTQEKEIVHTGIDFAAEIDTSVYALHGGRVIKASIIGGAGNTIALYDETTGLITLYEHLESYLVGKGAIITEQQARNGYVIGKSGNGKDAENINGRFDPHLHIEMIDGNMVSEDGRKVFQLIQDAEDGSLGINPPNKRPYSVQRLNPRPYLADIAISIAKSQLASENSAQYAHLPLTIDENLTPTEKQLVYDRSCTIFDCSVKAKTFGIDLVADKRDNTFEGNARDNIMIGDAGLDTYDLGEFLAGADIIDDSDHDGRLILGGAEISGRATCFLDKKDNDLSDGNGWILEHAGKKYYLAKVNDRFFKSGEGTHLMIIDQEASNNANNVVIKNFDFIRGGFGIKLVNKNVDVQVNDYYEGNQGIFGVEPVMLDDGGYISFYRTHLDVREGQIAAARFDANQNKIGSDVYLTQVGDSAFLHASKLLPNGNLFILFRDSSSSDNRAYCRFLNQNLQTLNTILIDDNIVDRMSIPVADMQTNGNIAVAWKDSDQLFMRVFTQDGNNLTLKKLVRSNYSSNTVVVKSAPVGFIILLEDEQVNGNLLVMESFSNTGQPLSSQIIHRSEGHSNERHRSPKIEIMKNGNYVINWLFIPYNQELERNGMVFPEVSSGVYSQIRESNGSLLAFQKVSNNAIRTEINAFNSMIALDNGNFVITWSDSSLTDANLEFKIFSPNGEVVFGTKVNEEDNKSVFQYITKLNNGNFVIAWREDNGVDGDGKGVMMAIYDQDGTVVKTPQVVNSHFQGTQILGHLSLTKNGDFLITYRDYDGLDGSEPGIFNKRFTQDGVLISCNEELEVPQINPKATIEEMLAPDITGDIYANIFKLPNVEPKGYKISNFNQNLLKSNGRRLLTDEEEFAAGEDQMDLTIMNDFSDEFGVQVNATQSGNSTLIDMPQFNINITLVDYPLEKLHQGNFIGDNLVFNGVAKSAVVVSEVESSSASHSSSSSGSASLSSSTSVSESQFSNSESGSRSSSLSQSLSSSISSSQSDNTASLSSSQSTSSSSSRSPVKDEVIIPPYSALSSSPSENDNGDIDPNSPTISAPPAVSASQQYGHSSSMMSFNDTGTFSSSPFVNVNGSSINHNPVVNNGTDIMRGAGSSGSSNSTGIAVGSTVGSLTLLTAVGLYIYKKYNRRRNQTNRVEPHSQESAQEQAILEDMETGQRIEAEPSGSASSIEMERLVPGNGLGVDGGER